MTDKQGENSIFEMTIAGTGRRGASAFSIIDPRTGLSFAQAPLCDAAQLDEAIASARTAFSSWSLTPIETRRMHVREMGKRIYRARDELAAILHRETGKPVPEAVEEVMGGSGWCPFFASLELPVQERFDPTGAQVSIHPVPIGVCAAVTPWNYPVMMAMLKVAPALIAGNTVVLKPSPFTPLATLRIGGLVRELLPPGVLNVISGGHELGPALTAHRGIDKISFTGSTATGRAVMANAASTIKRVTLELGGNDACIVFPDVDLDATVDSIFVGAFRNAGQICAATKRLYVHEAIRLSFLKRLASHCERLNRGETLFDIALCPMQNNLQFDRVRALIEDCRSRGYPMLAGELASETRGYFVPLTLVDRPPDNARIVVEEQFGPVLPVLSFADEDNVVARANATDFALGAQVWTGDEVLATRLASRLRAGSVWINRSASLHTQAPFGGHGESGLGVESALEGLLSYTNSKSVIVERPRKADGANKVVAA